jgi:dCMP deaminase
MRPSWDAYYLGIAEAVSKRGECTRRQVGAIIVNGQSIISTGYNGAPPGQPSCLDGACPRAATAVPSGTAYGASGCVAIHAEANAIIRAGRDRCINATIYVNHNPCDLCLPLIIAAGIGYIVTPFNKGLPNDGQWLWK